MLSSQKSVVGRSVVNLPTPDSCHLSPVSRLQKTMPPTQTFKELHVWQQAHAFVLMVYQYSSNFPREEVYGLTSQFRRASISIPANIAEGYKKKGLADKLRFINIAQASLEECRYYLILSNDLNYGNNEQLTEQLEKVSKMLTAYSKGIQNTMNS